MIDTFIGTWPSRRSGATDPSLTLTEWTVSGMAGDRVFPNRHGRVGDIFGRRRVYLLGLVAFVVASGMCGLAQNIERWWC